MVWVTSASIKPVSLACRRVHHLALTPAEQDLLALIRLMGYGEVVTKASEGGPVYGCVRHGIKLGNGLPMEALKTLRKLNESATQFRKNSERPMSNAHLTDVCPKPLDKRVIFSYIANRAGRPLSLHPSLSLLVLPQSLGGEFV